MTQEPNRDMPRPPVTPLTAGLERATFAGGCFWGVEAAFREVDGVVDAQSGYTDGLTEVPTYQEVRSQTTGHAEAVLVTFDPRRVSYQQLVEYFYDIHDPTTPGRQGPDVGDQYRSAIFFHTPQQEATALGITRRLAERGAFDAKPIVTQIDQATTFWPAEEYHQRYFEKTGLPSCHVRKPE